MAKKDVIEVEGVVDAQPNAMFVVKLESGHEVLAHVSGKIRMNYIRIMPGDKVRIGTFPYDLSRGRMSWRERYEEKMKVRASVKPICEKCKIIKRNGKVMVTQENLSTSRYKVNGLNLLVFNIPFILRPIARLRDGRWE